MLLSELRESLGEKIQPGSDPEIISIAYDSRNVAPGALFVCIRGEAYDGHAFAGKAVENGASAILMDSSAKSASIPSHIPVIKVSDTRKALPVLANHFFSFPSRRMKLVGVTGTKGKTTTTYLIESILREKGAKTGVVGTLGVRVQDEIMPLKHTTPESADLQDILAKMAAKNVYAAAMEVSSHALAMRRTEGCEFDVGVFTNLTHDHLDFHKTYDEYLKAKMTLFSDYPKNSQKPFTGIINLDDPRGKKVCQITHGRVITFGIEKAADIRAENISAGANSVSFDLVGIAGECHIDLKIGGMFNVSNALAAIGSASALGFDLNEIKRGIERVTAVSGRFEFVDCGQNFGVIVDYAHSPDSLENVLESARELTSGKLIVVVGCGGDRDKTKRPIMARIASTLGEVCIITSDNPRSEDPETIAQEMVEGADGGSLISVIIDRREAIKYALSIAEEDDLVVIAGKGHETYQTFKDKTIHFDDIEVVRETLIT